MISNYIVQCSRKFKLTKFEFTDSKLTKKLRVKTKTREIGLSLNWQGVRVIKPSSGEPIVND